MQALYGRNSESPIVVLAPATPGDCFYIAYEAVRIAIKYMVPVMVLSDGYPRQRLGAVAHPRSEDAAGHPGELPHRAGGLLPVPARSRHAGAAVGASGHARARAPHRRHREAGRHRQHLLRSGKPRPHGPDPRGEGPARGARRFRPRSINGPHTGDVLVVGWGGTYGAITAAVERAQVEGKSVASDPPAPSESAAARPRPHPARVPQGAGAGDQQRPARARAAGGVPRRRGGLQPRARLPLQTDEILEAINQLLEATR